MVANGWVQDSVTQALALTVLKWVGARFIGPAFHDLPVIIVHHVQVEQDVRKNDGTGMELVGFH